MVSGAGLKTVAAAGVLAAAVGGAVIARADDPSGRAAQAEGGLALSTTTGTTSSLKVDRLAQAGATDKLKVANNSKKTLTVTVTARPWTQSASGVVSPNRRATLGGVTVDAPSFALAPGASKDVTVTLGSVPSTGYLYGALEVVGVPADIAKAKGIVTGYRLLDTLRYNAATATYGLKAGAAKLSGTGTSRVLGLSVKNTGNTIAPVTGKVTLKSPLGTKNGTLKATRILPGKSVSIALATASSLRAGKYTATVTLIQNKQKTTLTKKITVR